VRVAETIILLLLGMIGGVVSVFLDVALVGSPAVLMHFAPWVLVNVILATHVADAREAVFGAVPLNLGLVETAVLATSMTYEGVSRKILLPMALLALAAPLIAIVAWMARRERHTLFGKVASVMLVAFTLLGCALLYGAPAPGDYVCAVLVLLLLLVVPTRMLRLRAHVPGGEGEAAADGGAGRVGEAQAPRSAAHRPAERRRRQGQAGEGADKRRRAMPAADGRQQRRSERPEQRPARPVERPSAASRPTGRPSRQPVRGEAPEEARRRVAERPEWEEPRQRPVAGRQRPARGQRRPTAEQQRPARAQQRPARGQRRPSQGQGRPSGQGRDQRPQRQGRQAAQGRLRPTKRTGASGQAPSQPERREDARRRRPRG
jgi:hypothetical protein